jgi:hypothetical protein
MINTICHIAWLICITALIKDYVKQQDINSNLTERIEEIEGELHDARRGQVYSDRSKNDVRTAHRYT